MSRNLGACHVLVVEDDVSIQQLLISHFLESMGIVDIAFAQDGIEGLEKARRRLPDLIVLDIEMPRMNGLEMLRHLKADPKLHGIPVIVQTAEESRDKREQMFEAGATDFVLKPLSINEFQGRIRVHIENLLHVRRLQADLARIAQELEDAAGLQRELLPTADVLAAVSSRYGLKISHVFEPSSELGGDFWGLLPINDHAVGIFICDFAGHGVSAAMNTFRLQTILDRLPLPDPENPAAYVAAVNQDLCKALSNRHYATFLFAVIDLAINRLHYASGAAPDPLTGRRGHAELKTLNGSGLPLGISNSVPYENRSVEFPPDAFLFLFSDALTEAATEGGKILGMPAICDLVRAVNNDPAPLTRILASVRHENGPTLADDLTAVWIERTGLA